MYDELIAARAEVAQTSAELRSATSERDTLNDEVKMVRTSHEEATRVRDAAESALSSTTIRLGALEAAAEEARARSERDARDLASERVGRVDERAAAEHALAAMADTRAADARRSAAERETAAAESEEAAARCASATISANAALCAARREVDNLLAARTSQVTEAERLLTELSVARARYAHAEDRCHALARELETTCARAVNAESTARRAMIDRDAALAGE